MEERIGHTQTHKMNIASHHVTSYFVFIFLSCFFCCCFLFACSACIVNIQKLKGKISSTDFAFFIHSSSLVIASFFCTLSPFSFLLIFIASFRFFFCDQVHLLYACFRSTFKTFENWMVSMSPAFFLSFSSEDVTTNKSSLALWVCMLGIPSTSKIPAQNYTHDTSNSRLFQHGSARTQQSSTKLTCARTHALSH